MTNKEEHELRIQYLNVLLGHGVPLKDANEYFEKVMKFDETKKIAQQAALDAALTKAEFGPLRSVEITEKEKEELMIKAGLKKSEDQNITRGSLSPSSDMLKEYADEIKKDLPKINEDVGVNPVNSEKLTEPPVTEAVIENNEVSNPPKTINMVRPKPTHERIVDPKVEKQEVPRRYEDRIKMFQTQ